MQPALGWTLLSRDALRRAEARLSENVQGVRDEIGFLALHQAYADRFFPGTSVLQTRLRYALFVPWIYERIASRGDSGKIDALIQKEEVQLAGRLIESGENGVIGGRSYPKQTSQPATMVYWTALGAWGILRRFSDGSLPSRSMVHRALMSRRPRSRLLDDEQHPLDEGRAFFVTLPSPPEAWHYSGEPLDHNLLDEEANFLRRHLVGVARPGMGNTPSLLARLVDGQVEVKGVGHPWEASVIDIADADDRGALERARQVAALSAIGRGVYGALVEQLREDEDKLPTDNIHRENLWSVVDAYRKDALALDIDAVCQDAPNLSDKILDVLKETQKWLRNHRILAELRPFYEQAEVSRKGRRARLAGTLTGRQRRAEWDPNEHAYAEPLHYRWFKVRRLLEDLGGK